MAVLAPMPSASVSAAMAVNPGARMMRLKAWARSCSSRSMGHRGGYQNETVLTPARLGRHFLRDAARRTLNTMRLSRLAVLMLALVPPGARAWAQTPTIVGVVRDSAGVPIMSAGVLVVGLPAM